MIIDIDNPNPPIKVFFEKEDDGAAFVLLRPAISEILTHIREKTHTRCFKNVRGVIHEYFEIDEKTYDFELWKYCLTGWGNINDSNGNPIEYSPEKAVSLINQSPYFSGLLSEKLDEVKEIMEKRAKAVKKN